MTTTIATLQANAAIGTLVEIGIQPKQFMHAINKEAQAWADDHAGELIAGLEDATRSAVSDTIAQGLKDNISLKDLAQQLSGSYAFSEDRAALIAVTETQIANGAGNVSGLARAKANGVDVKKEWIPDPDCCDICQDNADEGPIDVDDIFPSGDDAEPAHPHCQCYTQGVVGEQAAEDEDAEEAPEEPTEETES